MSLVQVFHPTGKNNTLGFVESSLYDNDFIYSSTVHGIVSHLAPTSLKSYSMTMYQHEPCANATADKTTQQIAAAKRAIADIYQEDPSVRVLFYSLDQQ